MVGKKEITYNLRLYPELFNYDADWESLNHKSIKSSGAVTIEYKTPRIQIPRNIGTGNIGAGLESMSYQKMDKQRRMKGLG